MSNALNFTASDDALLTQLGRFVQRRRIAAEMTQAEVSHAANLSTSTVSLLERGETVTTATLLRVLRVIDALDLLGEIFEERGPSPVALAKAARAARQRVRKTGGDELLQPEW